MEAVPGGLSANVDQHQPWGAAARAGERRAHASHEQRLWWRV